MIFGKEGNKMKEVTIKLSENEAVTMGQLIMEGISKRTYEPDNVNVKWLWMLLESLSEQMYEG